MGTPSFHRCKAHYVQNIILFEVAQKQRCLIGPGRCHTSMSIVDVMVIGVK